MCDADVTAISLVTNKTRDEICHTLIPFVARALSNQCVDYQRLPITEDYLDWVVDDTDEVSLALDQTEDACLIMLATRGANKEIAAGRLAGVAADLCRDYDVHTLFWSGSDAPIDARDFLFGETGAPSQANTGKRIRPRRILAHAHATARPAAFSIFRAKPELAQGMMRAKMTEYEDHDFEAWELEERRAKTVPLRLSAWALSISTALIAAPLAIPLIVHNLVRGEDVRSGALAFGVAGLFSVMAQTGLMPSLGYFV